MPKRRLRVFGHRDSREACHENEIGIVERILCREPEFLREGLRRQLRVRADRAVIRDDAENALGLLAFLIVGISGRRVGSARLRGRRVLCVRVSIRRCGCLLRVLTERILVYERNMGRIPERRSLRSLLRAGCFLSTKAGGAQRGSERRGRAKPSNRSQIISRDWILLPFSSEPL